nr:PREDICTED: uncharacterized protein LOC109639121 [Paralichthys olivaceus]
MAKIVLGIVAVIASFMLVNSLTCNKCSISVFGTCLSSGTVECATNSSVCFTGKIEFTSVTALRLNSQGCQNTTTGCNMTTTNSLLGFEYNRTIECCESEKCNSFTLSGAPTNKLTFTAAIGAALLASVWGSMQ